MLKNTFAENVAKARSSVGENIEQYIQDYLWVEDKDWEEAFQYSKERKDLAYIALDGSMRVGSLEPLQKFSSEAKGDYVKGNFSTLLKEVVLEAAQSRALSSQMMRELDYSFKGMGAFETLGPFAEVCSDVLCEDLDTFEFLKAKMPNLAKIVAEAPIWKSDFFDGKAWLFVELYPAEAFLIAERQLSSSMFDAHHFYRSYEEERPVRLLSRNYPELYANVTKKMKNHSKKGIFSPLSSDRDLRLAEQSLAGSLEKYKKTKDPILRDYNRIMANHIAIYKQRKAIMGVAKTLKFVLDADKQKMQ